MDNDFDTPDHPPRNRRLWLSLLGVGLIIVAAFFLLRPPSQKPYERGNLIVTTAPVTLADVPEVLEGVGTLQAYQTVTVRPRIDGTLDQVLFREGQSVKKGDLLAIIDPRTYQANYDQALAAQQKDIANLENAQRDLQRYENLGENIARQTLETQRTNVRQLEATAQSNAAAVKSAAAQLSYTRITAPISGRTGIRQVDAGNVVRASDANGIVVITQQQPVSVIFSLPQQNLPALHDAMAQSSQKLQVEAVGDDRARVLDTGVLELVDNQIDSTTGSVKLKATFPNKNNTLWPGGFVNVRVNLRNLSGMRVIPSAAIQQGAKGPFVYVLQKDDTVKIRPITPGLMDGDRTVIAEGLEAGEEVVTDGMLKLQDGSKVTVKTPLPAPTTVPAS